MKTISKVAKQLNVNVETIRFYERKGLIDKPSAPSTGYRVYPEATIARIHFIKRAQTLGFTLSEIGELLTLSDSPCHKVEQLAKQKLAEVKARLAGLQQLETALSAHIVQCQSNNESDSCPIINTLLL
nr:Hg(II)-responsive transcriptional regulator [Alteromonas lipotrueiana]